MEEFGIEKINIYVSLINDLLKHDKISRKLLEKYLLGFSKITWANKQDLEYEIFENKPRLIMERSADLIMYSPCPFCGEKHEHGENDGSRATHCPTYYHIDFVVASDGTKLYKKDGYLLKTITK